MIIDHQAALTFISCRCLEQRIFSKWKEYISVQNIFKMGTIYIGSETGASFLPWGIANNIYSVKSFSLKTVGSDKDRHRRIYIEGITNKENRQGGKKEEQIFRQGRG